MRVLCAVAVAVMLLSACSSVDEPRWADPGATTSTLTFESPRQEIVVRADPEIGNISLRGTVRGRAPHQVVAPADGKVLDVFFASGDRVTSDDLVLVFRGSPTEAELIALEIARLEVERAVARSAGPEEIATAQTALDGLKAMLDDRTQLFSAGATGVIGGARQNIEYSVKEGDLLFDISDPADIVVVVPVTDTDVATMRVGTPVVMSRSSDAGTETLTGSIAALPDTVDAEDGVGARPATVTATITVNDPAAVMLGDRLLVSFPADLDAETNWIPVEAVRSRAGASYVLVADDNDRLRRVDVVLGRRTQTHVQVLTGLDVGMRLVAAS